ncbi:glycosyltransferase family 2 protein [Ohessyouella blattaphilus]|uniref:glycosyltransferase family 2 protein n=1 Tax=Ohessyouella blattaphilus TaxID=2949333 RepID=UPI003E25BB69
MNLRKFLEGIFQLRGSLKKNIKKTYAELSLLSYEDNPSWYCTEKDKEIWDSSFKKLVRATNRRGIQLAREFYNSSISIIEEKLDPSRQDIIVICVAKNEQENMKKIYFHYRNLGVESFAFVDNASVDGSIELFRSLSGVNIYRANAPYTSIRRQAWINRIMAHYGYHKWYIVVDSDEFIEYNHSEEHPIKDVIQFCKTKGITRMHALMVDMYPDKVEFADENIDYLQRYSYFDLDTYMPMRGRERLLLPGVQGGVRGRVFAKGKPRNSFWLSKFPITYLEHGDVQFQSHMSFPFYKNFQSDIYLVLRHYKFLPGDLSKYVQRIKDENFAGGSGEYKQYLREMEKGYIVFFDKDHSESFLSSESFYKIPLLRQVCWEDIGNE